MAFLSPHGITATTTPPEKVIQKVEKRKLKT
jgi:hypothetical protein